jgi:hypothetical protein
MKRIGLIILLGYFAAGFWVSNLTAQQIHLELIAPSTDTTLDDSILKDLSLKSGDSFTLAVKILNVSDLFTYNVDIYWGSRFTLECIDAYEGDFLSSGGYPTFFIKNPDNFEGWVSIAGTRLGEMPGATGSGILAYVTFKIIDLEAIYKRRDYYRGISLDLNNVVLIDSGSNTIPYFDIGSGRWPFCEFCFEYNEPPAPLNIEPVVTTSSYSENPVVAIDSYGRPVIAWADNTSGEYKIYVLRYDGINWQELGTGSASGEGIGTGKKPSIAIGPSDKPFICWENSGYIYVKKFNGISWQKLAGSASGEGIGAGKRPSIAIDPSDKPVICWVNTVSSTDYIYVKKFDGTWQGGQIATGYNSYPQIAAGANKEIVVVFEVEGDPYISEIKAMKFENGQWIDMGSVSNNGSDSRRPSVLVTSDGKIIVAWFDDGNENEYNTGY